MRSKYRYLYVVQAKFSAAHGWEDADETEDRDAAAYLLAEYQLAYAGMGGVRMIERRELRE